jgi:hypothetical protein
MPSGEQKFGIQQIELTPMCEGKYATVTTEAAIPVCGILGRSLEKTCQECATEKYFKNVLTAVPPRNVSRHSHADRFPTSSLHYS